MTTKDLTQNNNDLSFGTGAHSDLSLTKSGAGNSSRQDDPIIQLEGEEKARDNEQIDDNGKEIEVDGIQTSFDLESAAEGKNIGDIDDVDGENQTSDGGQISPLSANSFDDDMDRAGKLVNE